MKGARELRKKKIFLAIVIFVMMYIGTNLLLDVIDVPEDIDSLAESGDEDQENIESDFPSPADEVKLQPDGNGNYTLVFSPLACESIFGNRPEIVVESLKNTEDYGNNCISIGMDNQDNLKIVLSEADRKIWEYNDIAIIQKTIDDVKNEGKCRVILSDDYKYLEYHANSETAYGATWDLMAIIPCCGLLQVLSGIPPPRRMVG
jgi:hypothetical protein